MCAPATGSQEDPEAGAPGSRLGSSDSVLPGDRLLSPLGPLSERRESGYVSSGGLPRTFH